VVSAFVGSGGHGLRDIGVVSNFSGSDGALGGGDLSCREGLCVALDGERR
jgi:hypothetical protein